jgi:hypothetical protein
MSGYDTFRLITLVPVLGFIGFAFRGVSKNFKQTEEWIKGGMKFTFMPRRDSSEKWNEVNPVLRPLELALELDTRKIKLGDGKTAYKDLPYEDELMPKRLVPEINVYRG